MASHSDLEPNTSSESSSSFLDEVLLEVLQHPLAEARMLHRMAVVLPSHRAMSKMKKALLREVQGPARLPRFFVLSGFIEASSSMSAADPLEVIARMYTWLVDEAEALSFERFVPWAQVVLADFASVDHELGVVEEVFQNLADIQGIEDWSFGQPHWSEDQKSFDKQWRKLPGMYHMLHASLAKHGLATRAHLTRKVAEEGGHLDVDHVVAAGLATMSKAEWTCLERWGKKGALTVLWDADRSYVDDANNDAGMFVRRFWQGSGSFPISRIAQSPPNVKAVGCSSTVAQCQYVRNVVSQLSLDELDETLVVLPDGSSLGTLLQSIPSPNSGINVTMGLALHETPIVAMVDHLFNMLDTRGSGWRLEQIQVHHANPVMVHVGDSQDRRRREGRAFHLLTKQHRAWVQDADFEALGATEWAEHLRGLGRLKTAQASSFLQELELWAASMESAMSGMPLPLDEAAGMQSPTGNQLNSPWIPAGWKRFRSTIAVLSRLQKAHAPMKHAREVRAMVRRLLRQERIDLLGEPDRGLQIMGLTETRALDFNRVLILDMNEGKVPQTSMPDSFLPLDLRTSLGLPGPRERQARYAYLVHRLLQRAGEVHLLYRSSPDRKEGGEPSRYLMQLDGSFHRQDGSPFIDVEHVVHQLPLPQATPEIPPLKMTEKMRERLKAWTQAGMSPSALNTMLQCPRNFAYRYIYNMDEATELQSSMEASTLGNVIHYVLEHGLEDAEGELLEPRHFKEVQDKLETLLTEALEEKYNAALVNRGENVLQLEIARSTLKKFFKQEMTELAQGEPAPILLKVEEKLTSEHPSEWLGKLSLKGTVDRRESVLGMERVVDYKSGKVKQTELNLGKDWTDQLASGNKPKALQLMVYATMVLASLDPVAQERGVLAAIRSGKNVRAGLLSLHIEKEPVISAEHAERFLEWLGGQVSKFFEEGLALEHAEKSKFCEHCVTLAPEDTFSF